MADTTSVWAGFEPAITRTPVLSSATVLQAPTKMVIIAQISPKAHRTYINYPQILELNSFTVSSPWGGCSMFTAAAAFHSVPVFRSTRYQLLLGGQRQCGFKACHRLLNMTSAVGIEPQTPQSRVQHLNRSAMHSTQRGKFE